MSNKEHGGESLIAILDQIVETIGSARAMPMSASVLVNKAELIELVNSAKNVVPSQISKADSLVAQADEVLARAQRESEELIERAQSKAQELVAEQAIVALAEQRATEIVQEAEATASRLMHDADLYCDSRLAEFEVDLGKISQQVTAGRVRLEERIQERLEDS